LPGINTAVWRPEDRTASPSLREKLQRLPRQLAPVTANASALIYNDRSEHLLHLRDNFPGEIWEPGMWSLLAAPTRDRPETPLEPGRFAAQ